MTTDLIAFFNGSGGDYQGRKLSLILRWPDERLELSHDYIQTLFPLPERSSINQNAPIINQEVFEAFRSQPELRGSLRMAFKRILSFYGLELSEDKGNMRVSFAEHFESAANNWVHRFDHNHLRITRIIRSLRVLGLEDEALAFFQVLKLIQNSTVISSRSLMFWSRAVERPLNIAPEISDDEYSLMDLRSQIGPKFLRHFETSRVKSKADEESTVKADGNNVSANDIQSNRSNGSEVGETSHERRTKGKEDAEPGYSSRKDIESIENGYTRRKF